MAALAPLVGQVAGVERRPISFEIDGLTRTVRAGGLIDQACTGVASGIDSSQAIGLDNTVHPVYATHAVPDAMADASRCPSTAGQAGQGKYDCK